MKNRSYKTARWVGTHFGDGRERGDVYLHRYPCIVSGSPCCFYCLPLIYLFFITTISKVFKVGVTKVIFHRRFEMLFILKEKHERYKRYRVNKSRGNKNGAISEFKTKLSSPPLHCEVHTLAWRGPPDCCSVFSSQNWERNNHLKPFFESVW